MNKEYKIYKDRIFLFAFLLSLIFIIFVIRLFYLQVLKYDYYKSLSEKQYVNKDINLFTRGNIYWTDKSGIYPVLAASDREYNSTNSKGVIINKRDRFYSFVQVGAKINGFVGYVGDEKVGQYGLEQYFNNELNKKNLKGSENKFVQLFSNNNILDLIKDKNKNTEDFGDIYTTIDEGVQNYLYLILKETEEKWHSDIIGGIVMDPSTGKILAMEEYPTFNPNNIREVKDISVFKNNLISGVYELGSIVKPLTMAAALDSGAVKKGDVYNDVGIINIDGYNVANFDKKARGIIPISETLGQSLNIGIVNLVSKMGIGTFQKYFKSFGLGQETGLSLFGEVNSLTANIDTNIFVNNATAGFGQGIALTPIQIVRALSAVANGGILRDPYLLDKIEYSDGRIYNFTPDEGKRVISEQASRDVTEMLVNIVDSKLYYKNNKDPRHSVAVKTGTAQLPKRGGGYLHDSYLHSFMGYFPANNPKYLVFLFQKNPKTAAYSSDTMAPAFFKMKNFLVDYYNVPPDR